MPVSTLEEARGLALSSPDGDLLRAQLPVHGLMCDAEAVRLEHHIAYVAGIHEVTVNPATDTAYITYDSFQVGRGELIVAITRAGFRTGY